MRALSSRACIIVRLAFAAKEFDLFHNLQYLNVVDNHLGDSALSDLSAAIKEGGFSQLSHLNLGSNVISDQGWISLATSIGLGGLGHLLHLSLARNRVADAVSE